jgi:protein phosphatase
MSKAMRILAEGRTDIGKKRAHNEDSFGVSGELGLYVVADGMGGHAAGEVASQTAVETLKDFIASTKGQEEITWPFERDTGLSRAANRLVVGIKLANQAIFKQAQERPDQKGMGTTIVAALVDEGELCIAHVGDSRAYVFGQGAISRITTDHSYVEEMVVSGSMTPEQARTHPLRNIVTRALGTKGEVRVDMSRHKLRPGDIYLLCSDGLTGMLTDSDIARTLADYDDNLAGCLDTLVKLANEKGGDDNITAVALRVAG